MRLLATSLVVTSLAATLVLPAMALAAPTRTPLPAQLADGPSLHPSGNNRYVEPGGSGTQGKASSDPDGLYNHGVDQRGEFGGLYLSDQDGNNGCGNDQDFEDDNNGRCGKAALLCPAGSMPGLSFTGRGLQVRIICILPSSSPSPSSPIQSPSFSGTSTSTSYSGAPLLGS